MKSLTKKLLASVFVMVFALVAVATTTFAWFTISNDAEVQTIDVDVQADSGDLRLRIDKIDSITGSVGTGLIKSIDWATIKTAIYGSTGKGTKFGAVTSLDGKLFGTLKDPSQTISNYGTYANHTTEAAVNGDGVYITFTLVFQASAKGYLVLTNKTSAEAKNTPTAFSLKNNIADYTGVILGTDNASVVSPDTSFEATDTIISNPVDPLRVSFVSDDKVRIYNPTTEWAHNAAKGDTDSIAIDSVTDHKKSQGNLAVQFYKNVWAGNTNVAKNLEDALSTDAKSINGLKYVANSKLTAASALGTESEVLADNRAIAVFNAADIDVSVKINLWMEGWDADCFNIILNTGIKINFGFALLKDDAPAIV